MVGANSERATGVDLLRLACSGGGLGGEVERDVRDGVRVGRVADSGQNCSYVLAAKKLAVPLATRTELVHLTKPSKKNAWGNGPRLVFGARAQESNCAAIV